MKLTATSIIVSSVFLLAACAKTGKQHTHGHSHSDHHYHQHGHSHSDHYHHAHGYSHSNHRHHHTGTTKVFSCNNGYTVSVRNLKDNKIEIKVGNRSAVLSRSKAASGELYTGNSGLWGYGGQWHQRGNTAHFEYTGPHGNNGSTTCRY